MDSDVYEIYPVVDAIAHEYEFGGDDDHTAAMRSPFDWMMYQIGMRSFRAFAGRQADVDVELFLGRRGTCEACGCYANDDEL